MDSAWPDSRILQWAERAAFSLLALLAIVPAAVAFTESYRGLYEWALRHALTGFWAAIWPAQVDVFIAAGELALLVAIIRRWGWPYIVGAAAVTGIGLAVSVAGNVGHLATADWMSRATAAVPPVAAAAALAIGLAVLKKVASGQDAVADMPAVTPEDTPGPRQKIRQPSASERAKANARARRLLTANPDMPLADVAEKSGVSQRTASRIKSGLPVPLRVTS